MPDLDPPMKVSFMVEITGCYVNDTKCPHAVDRSHELFCRKAPLEYREAVVQENIHKLTKTCPMVRAQFEALE